MTNTIITIGTNRPTATRQQMIENGLLIDISEQAREAGYAVPVAVTKAVWNKYVLPGEDSNLQATQDTSIRLKMILITLAIAIRKSHKRSVINFRLFPMPKYGIFLKTKFVLLKSKVAFGDDKERVLSIMLPRED